MQSMLITEVETSTRQSALQAGARRQFARANFGAGLATKQPRY